VHHAGAQPNGAEASTQYIDAQLCIALASARRHRAFRSTPPADARTQVSWGTTQCSWLSYTGAAQHPPAGVPVHISSALVQESPSFQAS
jgi:hypothetical protein